MAPMIFLCQRFEWKCEVDKKDMWDEFLYGQILEIVSNLNWAKWEKSDEVEDIFLIDKKEVPFFWVISSERECETILFH